MAAHDRLTEANPAILERASEQGSNGSSRGRRPHMLADQIDHGNLIRRRITSSRGLILAAPDYWRRRGRPSHPSELAEHDCIAPQAVERNNWGYGMVVQKTGPAMTIAH